MNNDTANHSDLGQVTLRALKLSLLSIFTRWSCKSGVSDYVEHGVTLAVVCQFS